VPERQFTLFCSGDPDHDLGLKKTFIKIFRYFSLDFVISKNSQDPSQFSPIKLNGHIDSGLCCPGASIVITARGNDDNRPILFSIVATFFCFSFSTLIR